MLPHLDPVLIGDDGQLKEYREETYYSSIGDPIHRHTSQLVGLYPGTIINSNTPEWLKGAEITLNKRGMGTSGWGIVYRLLMWARIKDGEKCHDHIKHFIINRLHPNLWGFHPPFQIDGNFGYTASIAEMLLQYQGSFMEILPALPNEWGSGQFTNLIARGNFAVSCKWKDHKVQQVKIVARSGGKLSVKLPKYLLPNSNSDIFSKDMAVGEQIIFE